jgi:hypothetical protein
MSRLLRLPPPLSAAGRRTANTTGSPRRERSGEQRAESEAIGKPKRAVLQRLGRLQWSIHAIQAWVADLDEFRFALDALPRRHAQRSTLDHEGDEP